MIYFLRHKPFGTVETFTEASEAWQDEGWQLPASDQDGSLLKPYLQGKTHWTIPKKGIVN